MHVNTIGPRGPHLCYLRGLDWHCVNVTACLLRLRYSGRIETGNVLATCSKELAQLGIASEGTTVDTELNLY